MNRSWRSITVVFLGLIIASLTTWLFLHHRSQSKPVKPPFSHPFLKIHQNAPYALFLKPATTDLATLRELADIANRRPGAGLWLDVRLNGSGDLLLANGAVLKSGLPLEIAATDACRADGLTALSEAAPLLRDTYTVLNLIARRPGLPPKLLEILGEGKSIPFEKVLIQSESDGILKELREAAPRGFFGSSQSTLIQLEILSALDLAGLPDLKSDALVSFVEESGRRADEPEHDQAGRLPRLPRLRSSTLEEAHRRGLRRYAGPVRDARRAADLHAAGYDGIVLTERKIWEDSLDGGRDLK